MAVDRNAAGDKMRQSLSNGGDSVDWITEDIAVGNYLEAQDAALLRDAGIISVVSLDRTLTEGDAERLGLQEVEAVPLEDGPGNDPRLFRQAVEALERLVCKSRPVLVQCHAGRSRSVVVVAGYLMRSLGIEASEALDRVAAKRPVAVTPGLERLLESLL
jgi:protein-tyrosine phosphatase